MAALRASAYYGTAAAITNFIIKPLIARRRPSGAGEGKLGPITTSFPSGHAAADLAFTFGAAEEFPALFFPLATATLPAHWSLVRSNGHHPSDVLLGGAVGVIIAWGMRKLWPVAYADDDRKWRSGKSPVAQDRHRDGEGPDHVRQSGMASLAEEKQGEDSAMSPSGAIQNTRGDPLGVSGAATEREEQQRRRRELRSLYTEVDGRRYHARVPVEQAANGPGVVLVHGFGVSSRNMVPTAEALAPHCRVYAPDLPRHGLSYKPPRTLDLTDLAEALAEWMTSVGLQQACLLGNSYGCQIIVEFALRHPDRVERLILQAPTVDPKARDLPRQLVRRLLSGWRERHEPADDETVQDWREIGLRQMVQDARYALRDRIEDKLPHLQAPTLVVRGSRDPIVPQRWAEEATALIPHGRLVVLPDAIHTITYTRPQQLVEGILPFLRDNSDDRRPATDKRGA